MCAKAKGDLERQAAEFDTAKANAEQIHQQTILRNRAEFEAAYAKGLADVKRQADDKAQAADDILLALNARYNEQTTQLLQAANADEGLKLHTSQLKEELEKERRRAADLAQRLAVAQRPATQPVLAEVGGFPGGATGANEPSAGAAKPQCGEPSLGGSVGDCRW